MKRHLDAPAVLFAALLARGEAGSPFGMCSRLEARTAAGDGVTLPDADAELARFAGTVDLARGNWPETFLSRAGETISVAMSPFTGCYEFFDESGEVFWTVVPAFPTTENWVAPFRHTEDGPHPDDGLYAPWRLVDVWFLSTTEHAEDTEGGAGFPSGPSRLDSHAERAKNAESFDLDLGFVDNGGQLRFVNNPDPTNLCFTSFSYTETSLFFAAAWPTNETLPESTLDLYCSTNLLDPHCYDSDGDGAPDGADPEVWALTHPMWATNFADANIGITWYHSGESFPWAVLQIGNLSRSLENETQPLFLRLPPGVIVPFSISSGDGGVYPSYWLAGRHVSCGPYLYDPPMWFRVVLDESTDPRTPIDFAVPVLSVAPVLDGQPGDRHVATNGSVCVHGGSPVQRFSWSVAPVAISEKWSPAVTGAVQIDETGPYIDVSAAPGDRTGSFGFLPVDGLADGTGLWGFLTNSLSAHLCDASPTNPICSVCGCDDSTTNAWISISQDYRYALFGTTNMSRFVATVQGGDTNDIVWTVSPDVSDGVWLHASDDPESVGEGEIAGVAQVWADSGFCTNPFTITASFTFAPSQTVSTTFTTLAIDAEAICAETDPSGFVVNPISVPIGETATFRVKVFPASVPDSHIEWRIVYGAGNATFVGPCYGREVHLRGTDVGNVWLEVHVSGYNGPIPQFQTAVMPLYDVPVVAWIVCKNDGTDPATTESRVRAMVDQANYLLRQVCISCYVHQINYTNRTDWLNLGTWGTPDFSTNLQQMTAVSNPVAGIEVHFVDEMRKAVGVNSTNGMALSDQADFHSFAHEAGHAMGLADVYSWHPDTSLKVTGSVRRNWSPLDWCGDPDRGFYPDADFLPQSNLVERLVMCGVRGGPQRDFSWGNVHGIRRTWATTTSFEESDNVAVGVFPGTIPPFPHHD